MTDTPTSPLDAIFDGSTPSVAAARRRVRHVLIDHGAPTEVVERAELIVSELATNAVEASPGRDFRIVVEIGHNGPTDPTDPSSPWPVGGELVIRVENRGVDGGWAVAEPPTGVPPSAARGRGLHIVRTLCDRFEIEQENGTVQVVAALTDL